MDIASVIRRGLQSGDLDDHAVPTAVELLIPLAADAGMDGPAARVVERLGSIVPSPGVAALIDWWVVCAKRRPSSGACFTHLDKLPAEWRQPLGTLRDHAAKMPSDVAALGWMTARRALDRKLKEFEEILGYHGGNYALGGERAAWSQLCEPYQDFLTAVGNKTVPALPDASDSLLRKAMLSGDIRPGSDRARYLQRNYTSLDKIARDIAALAPAAFAIASDPPPAISLSDRLDDLARVARVTLAELAGIEPAPTDVVGRRLQSAADATDDSGRNWLARLALEWHERHEVSVPGLDGWWAERRAIFDELRRLERTSDEADVSTLRELLDDSEDFTTGRTILEELRARQLERAKRQSMADRIVRLRYEIERLPANDAVELAGRLDSIEVESAGDVDEAAEALTAVDADVSDRSAKAALGRILEIADELRALRAQSLASETRARIERIREGSEVGSWATVEELEDGLHQVQRDVDRRLRRSLDELEARTDVLQPWLGDADAIGIATRLDDLRALLDDQRFVEAIAKLAETETFLDRVVPEWREGQGEDALLEHVERYMRQFATFATHDVRRFHVALKTKRFAILAGLTGTGKSTIARLYAEAVDATVENGRFERVAVQPNWVDQTEVLGYLNPLNNRFEPGWLAALLRTCLRNPDLPVFCVLDEMNLAPVEQYLADVLSAVEEVGAASHDVPVRLYSPGASPANATEWPATLPFPRNLFVVGTVNVDETTRPLSPRVLDRASVIQLGVSRAGNHHQGPATGTSEPRWRVRMGGWDAICASVPYDGHHDFLVELAQTFSAMRIGLGVRSHLEIERFCANATGVIDDVEALDVALLQRVIPKVRGFKGELAPQLERLAKDLQAVGAERSAAVVQSWLDVAVGEDAFIDGTAAWVGLASDF